MAEYVVLMKMTAQGATKPKEIPAGIEQAHQAIAQMGGKVLGCYALLGPYDFIGIYDLPGEEAAAAVGLGMAASGMVTTLTMRAFTSAALAELVKHLPGQS